jgi:hypothetical protein
MSFLKSAINQVGRDLGKVVSNQIFKDSHSSPYRRVGVQNNSVKRLKTVKTEFDKAIGFQTGFKPNTLITKLTGAYSVIKNEARDFVSDGYLDTTESSSLFDMMSLFNQKAEDICDILEINEGENSKELESLTKIVEKTNEMFKKTLTASALGCKKREEEHRVEAENMESANFLKYVGLHFLWMGKYARGEQELVPWKAILANIADVLIFVFPITRLWLLLKGVFTFPSERSRLKGLKEKHIRLAELENKRAKAYSNIG